MSKIVLFVSIISILCFQSYAQEIPNNSFETWASGEPDNWNTSNQNILGFDFTMVSKDVTDPQLGGASAKLTVVTKTIPFVGTYTMPGVLTLGILNIDLIAQTASVTGGYPFTGMPQKLTGYFKYQPVNNDICTMGLGLFKRNVGKQDTVAFGAIDTSGTFNSWTHFEIPINYMIWEAPDTMNILFLNTNPYDGLSHTGSKLWIDNLSFVYGGVAIEGLTFDKGISIYAERDSKQLVLSSTFEKQENLNISLFSIAGTEVRKWKRTMRVSTERLDVNSLPPGTYVVRIAYANRIIESRKITILN